MTSGSEDTISFLECDYNITNGDEFEFDDNDDDTTASGSVTDRTGSDRASPNSVIEDFAPRCTITPLQSSYTSQTPPPTRQAPPIPTLPGRPQIPIIPPRPKGYNT
ncbi:hypothetical protein NECAME_03986 [Necator americanus]|nr:hypothetical protein NECAME_03986 [Necator americanus]ETN74500.1 hypothetical protein NECAME_03986 [Necator americanus]